MIRFVLIGFLACVGLVAAQCSSGMPMAVADGSFTGLEAGQECFCSTTSACNNYLVDNGQFAGNYRGIAGTMDNEGKCNFNMADDSFVNGVFGNDVYDAANPDASVSSCQEAFFRFDGGGYFAFDDVGYGGGGGLFFGTECVCVEPGLDCSSSGQATEDNLAGDCVCPAGQTDITSDGGNCATVDIGQCVAPTPGVCSVGDLQATVNNDGPDETLCFTGGSDPIVVNDVLTLSSTTGTIPTGDYTVTFVDANGDFYLKMTLVSTDESTPTTIEWFASGAAGACTVVSEVNADMDRRKRQSGSGGTSPIPAIVAAAAVGDPHLTGPDGKRFDFFGVDGGIYNLFSTKQFVINMLLGKEAKNHFIKQVGVCFRGKCEQFGLARQRVPEHFISTLNKQLSKVGGSARFPQKTQMIIELELCQGHRIVLEKRITNRGKRIGYLDVEVEVPGCHDDFDGALGQTYKCKYAGEHKEKFVFQKSMEEHFRVKSLTSQFGLYNSTMVAPCQSVESFNTQGKSVSGKAHH